MADTTIYPFGTDGQLPNNIGIIDDLITGGASMALSARQGKILQEEIDALEAANGYFECTTSSSVASKTVTATNYKLVVGGSIKIKFNNRNTASEGVTLNINGTGAKSLYYGNEVVSNTNTWEAGEVLNVYYDGTNFYADYGSKYIDRKFVRKVSVSINETKTTLI